MGAAITIENETKVVALLARGDTYKEIQTQIEGGISEIAITKIKKRNKSNLEIISGQMLAKAAEDAMAIKQKANKKISRRLDDDDKIDKILKKANDDWIADIITWKEYEIIVRRHKAISIGELVTVSKEMHNQSTEAERPPASPQDMAALVAAIRSGDEVKLTQATFNAKST